MGTWCWTTRPRCGYQKGISFDATKHKLKLDLASVTVFQGLTKMPLKHLKLPKPQSSAKKHRGKSNHKGDHLQLWSVENMRNALVLYFSQRAPGYKGKVYGYKHVADAHHIPRETFRCRVKGPLTGLFRYLARGKGLTLEFPKLVHHLKRGKFCIF